MSETTDNLQKYENPSKHSLSSEEPEHQQPPDPPPIVGDCNSREGVEEEGEEEENSGGEDNSKAEISESLQQYEKLFAHRFSAEDHEFQQYRSRPPDPPPIVEGWEGRDGGNHRGRDNRYHGHRSRGWGGGRGWGGDHHRQQHWRDRDRHSGHGSGYQAGPPSSQRSYNSHHQRSQYGPY